MGKRRRASSNGEAAGEALSVPTGSAASIGLRDVARAAGISTATVSRAINRPEVVSEELRERVAMAAATGLGAGRSRTRAHDATLPDGRRRVPGALGRATSRAPRRRSRPNCCRRATRCSSPARTTIPTRSCGRSASSSSGASTG